MEQPHCMCIESYKLNVYTRISTRTFYTVSTVIRKMGFFGLSVCPALACPPLGLFIALRNPNLDGEGKQRWCLTVLEPRH